MYEPSNNEAEKDRHAVVHEIERYLARTSSHLHGIAARTPARMVAAEVERLNTAVRAVAEVGISPFAHPGDFLLELARAAHPCGAAPDRASKRPQTTTRPVGAMPSLAEAARSMQAGQVTSEQLTEQALARATQTQPTLNAFIDIWADKALERARQMDRERADGRCRGPLHGIPLAHKDCFEIAGHAATVGSRARPVALAERDARAIEMLDDAGAVTLGTLNMNEMVAGPTGQNPIFGDCCNALDPSRISGGSSSGSGAAVAAGAIFGSLGSDTGGSIRLPASVNGLFGLKPTYGRISRRGCFPRAFSLDCPGPLARTAEDCALLLHAVAGHDPEDPSSLDVPVPDYPALLESAADGSRVATLNLAGADACDPEIAAVFEAFLARVEACHGTVRAVDFTELSACYALGDVISKVEAATLHGQWMRANPQAYSQAVYSRTEPGLHVPAVRYLEALVVRANLLQAFLAGPLSQADILVCPTVPIPVPLRAEADMEKQGSVFDIVAALTRLTRPFSYLGVPVLTMPVGQDRNGMPVGAQIIGRPLDEARLLSFAHRLSAADGWSA